MATTSDPKIVTPVYTAYDPKIDMITCYTYGRQHDYEGPVPRGALKEHRPVFELLWPIYENQLYQYQGFDLDSFPGCGCLPGRVAPYGEANLHKTGTLFKMANRAIHHYNSSSASEYQYSFLAIEKVNVYMTGHHQYYFMTLKALNVTLATPIETFQAKVRIGSDVDKDWHVFFCHPKGVKFPDDSDWFLGDPEEEGAAQKSSHMMAVAARQAEDEYLKVGKKVCGGVHVPSKEAFLNTCNSIPVPDWVKAIMKTRDQTTTRGTKRPAHI